MASSDAEKLFFNSSPKVVTHGDVCVGGDVHDIVLQNQYGTITTWCRASQVPAEKTLVLETVFCASNFPAQFFLEHIQKMMPRGRCVMFQAAKDHQTWLEEQGWKKAFCVNGVWTMVISQDIDGVSQFASPSFSEPTTYSSPAEDQPRYPQPRYLQDILKNNSPVDWSVTLCHESTVTFKLAGSFTKQNVGQKGCRVTLVEMLPEHRCLLGKLYANAISALMSHNEGCKIEVFGVERLPEELAADQSTCFQTQAGLVAEVTHLRPSKISLYMSVNDFIRLRRLH